MHHYRHSDRRVHCKASSRQDNRLLPQPYRKVQAGLWGSLSQDELSPPETAIEGWLILFPLLPLRPPRPLPFVLFIPPRPLFVLELASFERIGEEHDEKRHTHELAPPPGTDDPARRIVRGRQWWHRAVPWSGHGFILAKGWTRRGLVRQGRS